jgi:hypothetical protein
LKALGLTIRGCDLVALKVGDIAPNGYAIDRVTVRQKKTGRSVKFMRVVKPSRPVQRDCQYAAATPLWEGA